MRPGCDRLQRAAGDAELKNALQESAIAHWQTSTLLECVMMLACSKRAGHVRQHGQTVDAQAVPQRCEACMLSDGTHRRG